MFLSNVPKEIRSTEMAEIPSELGAEQDTQHSGVGWGKSLTGAEGRAEGSSSLVPPPHISPGLGLFSQWRFVLVQMGCGKEQGWPPSLWLEMERPKRHPKWHKVP